MRAIKLLKTFLFKVGIESSFSRCLLTLTGRKKTNRQDCWDMLLCHVAVVTFICLVKWRYRQQTRTFKHYVFHIYVHNDVTCRMTAAWFFLFQGRNINLLFRSRFLDLKIAFGRLLSTRTQQKCAGCVCVVLRCVAVWSEVLFGAGKRILHDPQPK